MERENLLDKIKQLSQNYLPEVIEFRRHIHQYPELSFQEEQTAAFVKDKLENLGLKVKTGIGGHGLAAIVEGKNPSKKTIALRADMDALPIQEENQVDYASKKEGVMHACGHDVHTASLLGAAHILSAIKDEFEGTVKLIFQPAEEKIPGGASLMIKDGILKDPEPEILFAQHVYPELEEGKVGFRKGMYMASADEIYLTVKGKGGHAALPQNNIDPILIFSHIVVALQQVVSRNALPYIPTVLSIGKINANGATNIIPQEVIAEGTFRTMDEDWRKEAHSKITQIAEGVAKSMGGECEVEIKKGYPYLINDPQTTQHAINAAHEYLGKDNVIELDLRMTAEDFAYFSQEKPVCFYRLGISNPKKGIDGKLHTSTFNIDESALSTGMGLLSWIAVRELMVNN